MSTIPKSHPRYESLMMREKLAEGFKKGFVHETGLIAHGRGEAFDYLLGEKTTAQADIAMKTAAAVLCSANRPVISLNGNVVALASEDCVELGKAIPAVLEINLFHKSEKRLKLLIEEVIKNGAEKVLGENPTKHIPGLDHNRGWCEKEGIFSADVVLVPLEDGDRCQALKKMGKYVITIDLNPLSRTAKTADITIVDNLTRAVPRLNYWVEMLKSKNNIVLNKLKQSWNNRSNLIEMHQVLSKSLNWMD